MLTVKSFTFNPFQENTYILSDQNKHCWIIDPGMYDANEEKILFDYIQKNELIPQQIINTHGHIDHILGVDAVKQKYGVKLSLHVGDEPLIRNAANTAAMFGMNFPVNPSVDIWMEQGEFMLGEEVLEARFVPGHSPGSLAFYYPKGKWVIAGDVLFQRSIGRTDLPGGDMNTLLKSIRQELFTLPNETIVFSGHGGQTSIGEEKIHNPFLK